MADGSKKNISNLNAGDWILNKLNKPIKVKSVNVFQNQECVQIQLNNGTPVFYISADSKVYAVTQNPITSMYTTIADAFSKQAKLKKDLKTFSSSSDVNIETFDQAHPVVKTLYSFDVQDSTKTFIGNGVILCC